jgi:hypothetical protein
MKYVISEYELEQIIRQHLTDRYSSLILSEENAKVKFIVYGAETRIDEVEVHVNERH